VNSSFALELAPAAASPTNQQSDSAELQAKPDPDPTPENQDKPDVKEPDVKEEAAVKPPEPQPAPPPPVETKPEVVLPPEPKQVRKEPPKKKVAALEPRSIAADHIAKTAAAPTMGQLGDIKAAFGRLIVAHLQRHKRYPAAAARQSEEGTVLLGFTLNRQGRVLASHIAKSSGYAELDHEALDMLSRAQPFPAPPADLPGQQFPYTVPMHYTSR
jgi:protein TonB